MEPPKPGERLAIQNQKTKIGPFFALEIGFLPSFSDVLQGSGMGAQQASKLGVKYTYDNMIFLSMLSM